MGIVKETVNFSKDIASNIGNYFSNRRIPSASSPNEEAKKALENAPIQIEHLQIINALPPLYDNIVDPPLELSYDDYQYNLTTLTSKGSDSKGTVGRAYTRNVLASGNYLTLVPMEFDFSALDSAKNLTDGGLSNTIKEAVGNSLKSLKGSKGNPLTLWNSFNDAADIGSFGYVTRVASKRYWRHVASNMKAVIYALGIEYKVGEGDAGRLEYRPEMKDAMPDWILDNIMHNNFYNKWNIEVNNTDSAGKGNSLRDSMSQEDRNRMDSLSNELKASKRFEESNRTYGMNKSKNQYSSPYLEGAGTVSSSTYGATRILAEESRRSSKEIEDEMASIESKYQPKEEVEEKKSNIAEGQFYANESIKRLRSWVMATSNEDIIEENLPFVTFYVNGIIEKNMSASQNIGESELGAILSGNFTMGMLKNLGSQVSETDKSITATVSRGAGNTAQASESLIKEISYVGNESTAGYFASGYVPRVNKGVDGDISYSINLRALADGSDPISIAAHCMYTLALITPFYIEPAHKAYRYAFVPKAPLICSAFCKGVFNVPKGCIASIDIKTDPVFQTTESVSTDIEIHLTLVPFINKGFSPDFGSVFNATDDEHHIITAFFNPFSSLNILVTLCGMNTTMTKINEGLFKYFFWKAPTAIVNVAYGSWEGFKSSFLDFSSTTVRNLGLSRSVKAI